MCRIASERKILYDDVESLSEDEAYSLFFPHKHTTNSSLYQLADYTNVHFELKRVGVTLKLLWQEYKQQCQDNNAIIVGYSKYCDDYNKFVSEQSFTSHLTHKPGVRCEVDWSGPTIKYIDADTGEIVKVYLFVSTLPYSQYSYVEARLDMKQNTWLQCHVNMYQFFEGVPIRTICDNLKTGVIKHPKEDDVILNKAYEELGNHYLTAIMPAGVRKPKQKASVEATVGKIATAIIAKFRNITFYSFGGLKINVAQAMKAFNEAPFQKRNGSRYLSYLEEKPFLNELPTISYTICEWKYGIKVYPDCHIIYAKNHYSCPFVYRGKEVSARITDKLIEIYYKHQRIATHAKFPAY